MARLQAGEEIQLADDVTTTIDGEEVRLPIGFTLILSQEVDPSDRSIGRVRTKLTVEQQRKTGARDPHVVIPLSAIQTKE